MQPKLQAPLPELRVLQEPPELLVRPERLKLQAALMQVPPPAVLIHRCHHSGLKTRAWRPYVS